MSHYITCICLTSWFRSLGVQEDYKNIGAKSLCNLFPSNTLKLGIIHVTDLVW